MDVVNKDKNIDVCPNGEKRLNSRKHYRWGRWIFPLTGMLATIWFLIRVIPKPSRAMYPCQRAAFPLASAFVVYLLGLCGAAMAFRKAKRRWKQSRYFLAGLCIIAGFGTVWLMMDIDSDQAFGDFTPIDPPNTPIGQAKGIFPGRVVWVHDPNATSWDGVSNYWWDDNHTDPAVVESMMSKAVCWLTQKQEDESAWDSLFRHYNKTHGKGNVGYLAGERIVIKPNHNNQLSHNHRGNGVPDTPPVVYVALLKQLVYEAGVDPNYITISESSRYIDDKTYDACFSLFPEVRYEETNYYLPENNPGTEGRMMAEPVPDMIVWSSANPNTGQPISSYPLPKTFVEADYVINLARMQGHGFAGATLCGKNWYGCFCLSPEYDSTQHNGNALHDLVSSPQYGRYSPLVDLMGHQYLGGKTLLYILDGLWGFEINWMGYPTPFTNTPFNGDYPSSILVSQDPVAIDSVALDFLAAQFELKNMPIDSYLHEAALAEDPLSGVFYDPEGDGTGLQSLGVHEHWNNPTEKQYSRNLGTGEGIELISSSPPACPPVIGDINADYKVDLFDLGTITAYWLDANCNDSGGCAGADLSGDGFVTIDDLVFLADNWLSGYRFVAQLNADKTWLYQNVSGLTNSQLTMTISITDDSECQNNSYTYEWEMVLPCDVDTAPVTIDGGGVGNAHWTIAAGGCDQLGCLSDSGQPYKVKVTITGNEVGNKAVAEVEFGMALLGDVNNDTLVDVADTTIINAFWQTGSAGDFTLQDCDINSDNIVDVADITIANAVWQGTLCQNCVSNPCPFR
jgi:hypothetical protein